MTRILLALFSLLSPILVYGQLTVSGTVRDQEGLALPGVNIRIDGTTSGTISDINGTYSLSTPEDATLVFSYVSFVTQRVPVDSRSTIDIVLEPDINSLEEFVVIGYGNSTKKELTGAVSTVNAEEIQALNPQRIDQALQGQAAGVNVTTASGSPGGALNIRIRGLSTNGNNNPLIIIDGITSNTDALNALNPSDVESMNILKDASAGIYGVRAANGVILITTKKGRKNTAPVFEFNGYTGIQETSRKLDLLNAREYAILKNEAFGAGGEPLPFNNANLGEGTDWQDEVFQTAPIQNYTLSITGGTEKTSYSIGGSILNQDGIVGGDKASFDRYNARLNFVTELTSNLSLENVLLFSHENRKTLPENTIASVLYNTINANPGAPVYTNGRYTYLEEFSDIINPLAQIENTFNNASTDKVTGKQELKYTFSDDLSASARIGYNYATVDYKGFSPLVYYGSGKAQNTAINEDLEPNTVEIGEEVFIDVNNNVTESKTYYIDYTLEAFLNYGHRFGEHDVKGTLGFTRFEERSDNLSGTAYDVPYNSWEFADISLANGSHYLNNTSSYQTVGRLQSYFIRGEYGYQNKYLFSAILRRDASSNFGANNRFGYFPSFSGGWVFSEEDFYNFETIEFAKLRASYGIIGNDKIGQNRYRALLGGEGIYPFDDQLINGIAIGAFGNPDLKWETTNQFDIGLDLSMLNGKVNITTDYFIKQTRDLLFVPDVSGVIGAYGPGSSPPYVNAGDIKNTGFEFLISYTDKLGSDFNYNASYNFTTYNNEVVALPEGVDFYEYGAFGVGGETASRMEVGMPMGYFFGYETDGIYQSDEEVATRGITQNAAQAGDLRFVDQNGDGEISFGDDEDKTIIGSPIPDFTMGLNLGFNFKGIDFSMFWYASIGNEILRNYERNQPMANNLAYNLERWTGEGSTNEIPRLTTSANNNRVISDFYVEDGSYARLRNVQLGYTFPSTLTQRIKVQSFRIYASVNNLVTLTRYMGYDPDISNGSAVASGIDYGFYPQPRIYMLGVNLKF